ncbi:MAG: acetyl-CoA carboxylase biotin carboxylase subunit [Vulcanimicrobiaceae bacterium]
MFAKVLIANRGEIAIRIVRTLREMGVASVAIYSEADRDALHPRMADEAFWAGPASPSQSYLDAAAILEIAARSGADAIHPGYGFLAENADFARRVVAAGLSWIGPHPAAIDAMGDKLRSRQAMAAAGVPLVPGGTEPLDDVAAARAAARKYGFPLALKASAGGGGKGLKVARSDGELESAFATARREAEAYFKNGTVYAERYLDNPKHVELQILADKHGNVVHVGERDCSLQRRHQKLWEEAPAAIPDAVRHGMREAGVRAAKAIAYDSVGTVECLVSGNEFFFLEMNTRIQVEHTVSETIAGMDLVREQIRVAAGEPLGYSQNAIDFRGHAIEVRVNAEDPADGFRPAPGTIRSYREPGGLGVRVDSAAFSGVEISPDYDSMIAKLVVWAPTRAESIARLARAIDEFEIDGVPTTLPLLRALCDAPEVRDASYGTASLERFASRLYAEAAPESERTFSQDPDAPRAALDGDLVAVEVNGRLYRVRVLESSSNGRPSAARGLAREGRAKKRVSHGRGNDVLSPMHGVVVEVGVAAGDAVTDGQVVAIVEAMKMMNEIRAHRAGTVGGVHVAAGDTIEANSPLLTID